MKKTIKSAFSALFNLVLVGVAVIVAFGLLIYVVLWFIFSGDYLVEKSPSPDFSKDAYAYMTTDSSSSSKRMPYGAYYLVKSWSLTNYWTSSSMDDAFFAGYCNPLVKDEKHITWLSNDELQFYCHISNCESIVKIYSQVNDVRIRYVIEQDSREKRNCLAEVLPMN